MPSGTAHTIPLHRRSRTTPVLTVDDSGDLAAVRARFIPAVKSRSTQPPRTPWQQTTAATLAALLVCVVLIDMSLHLTDQNLGSTLRTAAGVAVIVFFLLRFADRLAWRVERLHEKTRPVVTWWQQQAAVTDERDEQVRRALQDLTEDVALIGRAAVESRRVVLDVAAAVAYANARLNAISQQVVSLGGGQAVVAGALDQLSHVMTHLLNQQPAGGAGPVGDDRWRSYLRDGEGELNLDQLRGYLMGIYDRERGDDDPPQPVA